MKFECIMIARVPVEIELPDGTYYNHSVLDEAVRKEYGDQLPQMLYDKSYMEHFTRIREE